jgi:hypothetical protein
MGDRLLDFVPSVFFKVLAVTVGLMLLGWAAAAWLYGELTRPDIIGSLISALILAYLVHLWIVYARDREPGGEE